MAAPVKPPQPDEGAERDVERAVGVSADLLGRLAAGLCDDPVSLAAVTCRCPRLLCPAMNDAMWEDSIVQGNVGTVREHGYDFLGPVEGHLAEGYDAVGRMVEPEEIVAVVKRRLGGGGG